MYSYDATRYNLIYIYSIPDENHKGQLKIGKASLKSIKSINQLPPNCDELISASHIRIKQETKDARVQYKLEYCELAVREVKKSDGSVETSPFIDKDVIKLLSKSGFKPVNHYDSDRPSEWVEVDLENAIRGIKAFKEGKSILVDKAFVKEAAEPKKIEIKLRKEQEENVEKTLSVLKNEDKMLWNCKMRYGKTVTAYELIRRGIEEGRFKKTIVITHRPAVEDGWGSDHALIFDKSQHTFIDKSKGSEDTFDEVKDRNNDHKLHDLKESGNPFIYFASIQDLRGSKRVGGKYNKNNGVFDMDWDLLIIDEAHEGTTTELGKAVISTLLKPGTKKLELSGTPYEQLKEYGPSNTYSWSYVDEQRAKENWEIEHPLEENPYADLPKMNICTFDLGDTLQNSFRYVTKEMTFSFREFFRTWTGNIESDLRPMPEGAVIGDFIHEADVKAFLNLITTDNEKSCYPFSTFEFRDQFRHTFWTVPGVRAGAALSKLLKKHPVFMHYEVVNVAGEGDEGYDTSDPLRAVREAIKNNPYTITLSCGKLTTGVTVREWSACMMLSGSYSTSAQNYMQTIFRVQSPGSIDGRRKENVYVFDFAPDRTLKVVSDVHDIVTTGGLRGYHSTSPEVKAALEEFLRFCPVLSFDGTRMLPFDVDRMMRVIKRISIEKAISSGFDDDIIYRGDAGIVFREGDEEVIKMLSDVVDPQHKGKHSNKYIINDQGLTGEDVEKGIDIIDKGSKKKKTPLTPEQQELKEKLNAQKKEQQKLFNLLRAISIRLPLLFYGADADINEINSLAYFADRVDEASWEEFMPKGLSKELFKTVAEKFFDQDVVIGAGMRIRKLAHQADELLPTKRAKEIVSLMSTFKNPDKETVLTPWRVVNMHIGDTLGGYNFFNETYTEELEEPRLIEHGDITADVFCNPNTKILEMNSKSGLYPLYMTFGIYLLKINGSESDLTLEEAQRIWAETVSENIFVLCKTPMAAKITKRTLMGYGDISIVNTCYLPHLIDSWMKEKQDKLSKKLRNPATWGKQEYYKEGEKMTFDAIVGNPPYQVEGGSGGNNDAPIYQSFAMLSENIGPNYSSLIMPARWFSAGRENLLGPFRRYMLSNKQLQKLITFTDSSVLFPTVEIKGGLCYYLINQEYHGLCQYTLIQSGKRETTERDLSELDILIRDPHFAKIVFKVMSFSTPEIKYVDGIISNDTPFGISSNPRTSKKSPLEVYSDPTSDHGILLYHIENNIRKVEYVKAKDINKNAEDIAYDKVFIPGGYGAGETWPHQILGVPELAPKDSVCSQSYLYAKFLSAEQAINFISYYKTKFFRALVASIKITQSAPSKVYKFVPLQDFTENSDIDWSDSIVGIDRQLYAKYGLSDDEIAFIESMIKPME